MYFAICNHVDGFGGHNGKWNKSAIEREVLYDVTYMWNLKIQLASYYNKKEVNSDIDNKLVVTSREREVGRGKTEGMKRHKLLWTK